MYFNALFFFQYESKNDFANTYYYCAQEFQFIFSVWFFIKSVYNCGILYLIPITLMIINYGRMTHTLLRSLQDSYKMQGDDRWESKPLTCFKTPIQQLNLVALIIQNRWEFQKLLKKLLFKRSSGLPGTLDHHAIEYVNGLSNSKRLTGSYWLNLKDPIHFIQE